MHISHFTRMASQKGRAVRPGSRVARFVAASVLASLVVAACADERDGAPATPTAVRSQAFSSAGTERVIPLIFRHVSINNPPTPYAARDQIDLAIDRANRSFRTAGIQFRLKYTESIYAPQLFNAGMGVASPQLVPPDVTKCWDAPNCSTSFISCPNGGTVWTDAVQLYPSLTRTSIPACTSRLGGFWLDYLAAGWSESDSITVWVTDSDSDGTCGPQQCRSVFMIGPHLAATVTFAHELGHYFGLTHTGSPQASWDAEKATPAGWAGAWDLAFFPGTSATVPHRYFSSPGQITPYLTITNLLGQSLQALGRNGSSGESVGALPS